MSIRRPLIVGVVSLILFAFTSSLAAQTIWYVDDDATGANDGTSWDDAFTDPQAALTAAQSGDSIWVAAGTYKPTTGTDRTISFVMKEGVALYGGFAGIEDATTFNPADRDFTTNETILSGDIGAADDNSDNSYHVVIGATNATLDGFTITGGNANGSSGFYGGGGMYNNASSPTVINCTFSDNSALSGGGMNNYSCSPTLVNCLFYGNMANSGGGIYSSRSSSPTVTDCVFKGNTANSNGGGMFNLSGRQTVIRCVFTNNKAANGGGMYNSRGSSPIVSNCTFIANTATIEGGGGILSLSSNLTLVDCTLSDNTASNGGGMLNSNGSQTVIGCIFNSNKAYDGGGMYNTSSVTIVVDCVFKDNSATKSGGGMCNNSGGLTLINCNFSENSALGDGGGICNLLGNAIVTNCIFIRNTSAQYGGGMFNSSYVWLSNKPTLTNCTFSNNKAMSGGGMYNMKSNPTIANCIMWGNIAMKDLQVDGTDSTPTIVYSNIQGGYAGTGNIDARPFFARNPYPGADGIWGTADDDYGDLRLRPGSPCIDAGSNAGVPAGITIDLDGNPRFVDDPATFDIGNPLGGAPIVDMGAYEYDPSADYDGDGELNLSDNCLLTNNPNQADTDNDGIGDACEPQPIYVDDTANGANNGSSWTDAYINLQDALAAAQYTDTIWVAVGIYKPTANTDRTISFAMREGVSIHGGFTGDEVPITFDLADRDFTANETILSGDIGIKDDNSDNSYHVVIGANNATLDGFTVTGGNANEVYGYYAGGGMLNEASNPRVTNCTFRGNSSVFYGGGMCNGSSNSPLVINCIFQDNSAGRGGGGMYNGYSSPTVKNCIFSGNRDGSGTNAGGGGMRNVSSSPTVTNCTFIGNRADKYGGGMINWFSYGAETSYYYSNPTMINCTFVGNSAGLDGGGMFNIYTFNITKPGYSYSSPTVTNCTFSGNSAAGKGGGMRNYDPYNFVIAPELTNCILWNNSASTEPQISNYYSVPTITYSDVQGGYSGGAGIIDADPLFARNPYAGPDGTWGTADDDYGDLNLQAGSPCIDAGDNMALPVGVILDLASHPRFMDDPDTADTGNGTPPIVDMGAYEYLKTVAADFSNDGDVDAQDFEIFAACVTAPAVPYDPMILPESPPGCPLTPDGTGHIAADFDCDGDVDQEDFGVFQRCYSGENKLADPGCG